MDINDVVSTNTQKDTSRHQQFLELIERSGGDSKEIFTTKEEFINEVYGRRWHLSNISTRGKTTDLNRLYELELSFNETHQILKVFKFWAQTKAATTTDSRIGVICKIIENYGGDIIRDATYLKSVYGSLTMSYKKNINYLFYSLYEKLKVKSYKEHRDWTKDNLEQEKINPHDPVNGAYSDYEYNEMIDCASVALEVKRKIWQDEKTPQKFSNYSSCIYRLLALVTSRRPAQLNQCKICDILNYSEKKPESAIDGLIVEIQFFKSKVRQSSFRSVPEKSGFPLSEHFTKVMLLYLLDLKDMIRRLCFKYDCTFDDVPWKYYPLFPEIKAIKSKYDLISPQLHSDRFHRTLNSKNITKDKKFNILRLRHTTITRGMEAGLELIQLARLTGVTTAATRNYRDLSPHSRRLINERFCKNELLKKSFGWTISEYKENFAKVYLDEYGNKIGGVNDEAGCRNCSKQLGAPLGCYSCGADLFVPFIEGNHKAQLKKAIVKQAFLEATGANQHQMFEINLIIHRIRKVIDVQENYRNDKLEGLDE